MEAERRRRATESAKATLHVNDGSNGAPMQTDASAGDWLADAATEGGAASVLAGEILARREAGMGRMATEGKGNVAGRTPEPCNEAPADDTASASAFTIFGW